MDAELKAKWIGALRSGEYEQCRGQLKDGDKFCCLGVLATVAGFPLSRDGMRILGEDEDHGYQKIFDAIGGSPEKAKSLYRMNDTGSPFAEIAEYIEANL